MSKEIRKTTGEGHIYVITNPAWPGYCKVGRSLGVTERLRTYQTASPHRDYTLEFTRRFADVHAAERRIRAVLPAFKAKGEWHHISVIAAISLLHSLPST